MSTEIRQAIYILVTDSIPGLDTVPVSDAFSTNPDKAQ